MTVPGVKGRVRVRVKVIVQVRVRVTVRVRVRVAVEVRLPATVFTVPRSNCIHSPGLLVPADQACGYNWTWGR